MGLTYLLGRELDPRSAWLARGAGLINALIPQFLFFISGAVNNDNLVMLLSSLALLPTVRLVHRTSPSLRGDLLLGATVGLASLTKLSGLLLLPLVVGAVLWWGIRRRSPGWAVARAGLIVGVAVLIGGWWYGRNWLLTGDPTLVHRHLAITGGRSLPLTALLVLLREGEGLRWSLWGVSGWFSVIADRWVDALYGLLGLLALVGLLLIAFRRVRGSGAPSLALAKASHADRSPLRESPPRRTVVILALWVVLVLAALLDSFWPADRPAALAALPGPGRGRASSSPRVDLAHPRNRWAQREHLHSRLRIAGRPNRAEGYLSRGRRPGDEYARPRRSAGGSLHLADSPGCPCLGDALELIDYRLDRCQVSAGRELAGGLHWRDRAPVDRDYTVFLHLTAANRHPVAQKDRLVGDTLYPTSLWQPGEEVCHPFTTVLAREVSPRWYTLIVGLHALCSGRPLTISPSPGQVLARLIHRLGHGANQDATTGALETILIYAVGPCSPAGGQLPAERGRLGGEGQARPAAPDRDRPGER